MKKNIMWNTIGSVYYSICQWVMTVLIVWIIDYTAAGLLSIAMTTSSCFAILAMFSMRNFQVSDINEEYNSSLYTGSRIITCIAAFFLCLMTTIVLWPDDTEKLICVNAFMLIRVVEAAVDVLHGIDQKHNRYDYIGKSYIIRGTLSVLIFITGNLVTGNLFITLCIIAVAELIVFFAYDWIKTYSLETFLPKLKDKRIIRLLKNCFPIVIFNFLLGLESLIPKTVLEQLCGTEELGIYSSLASPAVVIQLMASVIFIPFLPSFTKAYFEESEKFSGMVQKMYTVMLAGGAAIIVSASVFGRFGLQILFGKEILEHYYLFTPIVISTLFVGYIWIISALLIAIRKIKQLTAGMLISFIICVTISVPVIEESEKNGVSIVQIIVYALFIIYMTALLIYQIPKKKKVISVK